MAARDRTIVPTRPSKSPSSLCRPEATRLLWPWLVTSHSRPPGARHTGPALSAAPAGSSMGNGHGGLSFTHYFWKCNVCSSTGKREAICQPTDC